MGRVTHLRNKWILLHFCPIFPEPWKEVGKNPKKAIREGTVAGVSVADHSQWIKEVSGVSLTAVIPSLSSSSPTERNVPKIFFSFYFANGLIFLSVQVMIN